MCAPPKRGRGRPALYPWELWTDGRVHSVHATAYATALDSLQMTLRHHARTRGLRLRVQLLADHMRFQFLPDDGRDFDLEDRRSTAHRPSSKREQRRETVARFVAGKLTPEEAQEALGGVTRTRLYQVVSSMGLSDQLRRSRYPRAADALSEADVELWRTGQISTEALARRRGISTHYLRFLMRQAGVELEVVPYRKNGMQRKFNLTDEEVRDYLNGAHTVESLAAHKNCSMPTVANMLVRQGVRKKAHRRSDCFRLSRRECRALERREISQTRLAELRGVSNQTVRKAMLRQNVKVQPPREELP